MPEFLSQWINLWKRLTFGQRLAVVGAIAGTIGLMSMLIYFGSQPEYGVLFSDLKTADAQSIIEKLKTENVPYRLSNGGTMISVPSDRVPELRLQMAANNSLTGGHVGFDIFDRGNFGVTDFTQKVNYQRALEGELARTLEAMDEVETARVHITAPRESVFAEQKERGKASVVLRMRQARELSRERTDAVVNLIASAAEGLDPADVSVMDTRGRLLTAPGRNKSASESSTFNSHLETRQKLETETAARIVSLLEPVVGKGHVQADVAAEIDFSQVEQTEEKYDPKSSVIRSQESSAEYRSSGLGGTGGLVGARANDPAARQAAQTPNTTPAPATQQNQPSLQPTPAMPQQMAPDQRNASTINYEIDKTVRRTIGEVGKISRLSASVLVDHKLVNGNSIARSPEELKKIQELIAAAIGTDAKRGDLVVVESFPFDKANEETAKASWLERYRELILMGIKYGMLVLAVLLLILFVVRPAQRALKAAGQEAPKLLPASTEAATRAEGAEQLTEKRGNELNAAMSENTVAQLLNDSSPRTVAELEAEMKARTEPQTKPLAGLAAAPGAESTNESSPFVLRTQLSERSRQEPETVAMTLRSWIQETR